MLRLVKYILFILIWCASIQAQQPTYQHYTQENGLPTTQIYNIIQDQQGFIWIATAMGVCIFDGNEFINYPTATSLGSNHILAIKEDTKGRIWLLATNGKTAYIDRKKKQLKVAKTKLFGSQKLVNEDVIVAYQTAQLLKRRQVEQDILPNQKAYFVQAISCQLPEDEHRFWLGTWGGGAFYCTNYLTDSLQVQSYLPNQTITSIFKDREENYWFTTLDNGIFLLTNPAVFTFTKADGLKHDDIQAITPDKNGSLWLGDSKGTLSHLQKNGTITPYAISFNSNTYNRIHDIFIDNYNYKWLATDEGLEVFNEGNVFFADLTTVKAITKSSQTNNIWVAKYQTPFRFDTYLGKQVDTLACTQVNSILEDKNGVVWLGTAKGLYAYKEKNLRFLGKESNWLRTSINDLKIDSLNQLWIATENKGILVKTPTQIIAITPEKGLASLQTKTLYITEKQKVWIGTNKGINSLSIHDIAKEKLPIKTYTTLEGLAANQVNKIWAKGDSVWVGTIKGLTLFRPSKVKQQTTVLPPLYIQHIQVNYQDTSLLAQYDLPYYKNHIHLKYIALSYQSMGTVTYCYRLLGLEDTWQNTQQTTIQYPSLPPNQYTFQLFAKDKNGQKSTITQIKLHIQRPYWQQWWFRILLLVILLIVVVSIAYLIIRYFKTRNELQRRMLESEQMALRTQMNPHFIFNSLNSIQYFITKNDKRSANLYLSVFATLIRKVLNNSKRSSITLEEEIAYLNLYLQIESLRFTDSFTYQFLHDPNLEVEDINVPPMLIQPYVENAIQHGLLPKKEDNRLVTIQFKEEGDLLICQIEDNGIGRAKSLQNKRKLSNNIGIVNPKKRLAILNQLYKGRIEVAFFDKQNEEKEPSGTLVTICIPIDYE